MDASEGEDPSNFPGKTDSLKVTLDETMIRAECLSQSRYAFDPGSSPTKIALRAVGDSLAAFSS